MGPCTDGTKHTPGPWHHGTTGERMRDEYSQPFCVTQYGKANLIAGVFGDVQGGEDVAQANAHLLAAAPDLLAALEVCETVLGESAGEAYNVTRELSDVELGKLWVSCIEQVRSAIKRARGE